MANSQHPTPPPLMGDDITRFRHVIPGGPGNTRHKITVEVVSLVDSGEASPPILSVHGELDMSTDQAAEFANALTAARAAYAVALKAHLESLR
jgi:acetyl esterase/lipase